MRVQLTEKGTRLLVRCLKKPHVYSSAVVDLYCIHQTISCGAKLVDFRKRVLHLNYNEASIVDTKKGCFSSQHKEYYLLIYRVIE